MLAIATAILAVAILVLRINFRTVIIFYGIGVAATTLWMFVDARYFASPRKNIQPTEACACLICKHDHAVKCLKNRCACCLIKNDEQVVGHSSSSLQ